MNFSRLNKLLEMTKKRTKIFEKHWKTTHTETFKGIDIFNGGNLVSF